MKYRLGIFGVFLIVCFLNPAISGAQDVIWNVSTDRGVYLVGQPVTLFLEACNTGATTETVDINAAPSVIDGDGNQVFAPILLPFNDWVDIPAGECRSALDQYWNQLDSSSEPPGEQVAPGWYRGEFLGPEGQEFYSLPFLIQVPQPVPVSRLATLLLMVLLAAGGWVVLRSSGR